ncbi:MAG: O-antigen ligase family protein [Bacteroidales bacterium]|nr:O-antigen ligase family protein [Bacteroidales bacterium]
MAIGSNCFNFIDPAGIPIKPFDFIIVFTLLTCIVGYSHKRAYFRLSYVKFVSTGKRGRELKIYREKDWIGTAIFAIVIYLLLNFLGSIIFSIESPSNALKVVRPLITFLLYFYLRTFKLRDFYRFLYLILIASIIQGVFFYLQIIGVNVLAGRVDEAGGTDGMTRYANFPTMSSFFVIYYLLNEKEKTLRRIFFVLFFGTMVLLGQMRGEIIGVSAVFVVYFLLKRKIKYVGYIIIGIILYQLVIAPMFEYRTRNSSTSTVQEIVNVVTNPLSIYNNYIIQEQEGTFSFRIAMLSERVFFMFDNPQYFPFGIGCIHEDSDSNHFIFSLGTHNEMYKYGYSMLSSADIAWVGILMRYGMLGVILFMFFFYAWVRVGIPLVKKNRNILLVMASLFVVSSFMLSFNSENLGRVPSIMLLTFYCAIIYVFRNSKACLQNCS